MDTKHLLQRQKQTAFALGRGCAFVVNHPRVSQLSAMEQAFRSGNAPSGLILLDVGEKSTDPTYAVFGSDEWAAHAQAHLSAHPLEVDGVQISFSNETRPSEWPTDRSLLRDRPDRRCWLRPELNLHSANSFAPDGFLKSLPQTSERWARTTRALKDESAGYWVDETLGTLVTSFARMQVDPTTVTSGTATPGGTAGDTLALESCKRSGSTRPDSLDLAPEQPQKRLRRDADADGSHERNERENHDTTMSLHGTPDRYPHETPVISVGDAGLAHASNQAGSPFVHIFGNFCYKQPQCRLSFQPVDRQEEWLREILTLGSDVPIVYVPFQRLHDKQYIIVQYHSPSVARAVAETYYGADLLSFEGGPLMYATFSPRAPYKTVIRCMPYPSFAETGGHPLSSMVLGIIAELVRKGCEYPVCAVRRDADILLRFSSSDRAIDALKASHGGVTANGLL